MIGRETEDIKQEAVQCAKKHLKFGALYLSSSISLMSEVTLDNFFHFSQAGLPQLKQNNVHGNYLAPSGINSAATISGSQEKHKGRKQQQSVGHQYTIGMWRRVLQDITPCIGGFQLSEEYFKQHIILSSIHNYSKSKKTSRQFK